MRGFTKAEEIQRLEVEILSERAKHLTDEQIRGVMFFAIGYIGASTQPHAWDKFNEAIKSGIESILK
jgi:hypothetical protein